MPSQPVERRDRAGRRDGGWQERRSGGDRTMARRRASSLFDGDLAPVEQNLANADDAGEQQRHVEVDERGGPVDPGDRAQAGSRLRARHRLDVLLDDVQRRSAPPRVAARWPPGGFPATTGARASPGTSAVRPRQIRAHAGGGAVEPLVQASATPARGGGRRRRRARARTPATREHVGVHRVGHRRDDPRRSPDPEVLERVADEQPDEREQDAA